MAVWTMSRATTALAMTGDPELLAERRNVELALQGDALAFRAIVERHHRGMFGLAVRLVRDRIEAEDLVQEAFARAYCKLAEYDPSYRLSTWLYRITLNVCRDYLKSPRRRERPSQAVSADRLESVPATPERNTEQAFHAQRVQAALAQLKHSYREILVLKDLQELSYQEIRAVTGLPITALKIRAVRARKKLRTVLEAMP